MKSYDDAHKGQKTHQPCNQTFGLPKTTCPWSLFQLSTFKSCIMALAQGMMKKPSFINYMSSGHIYKQTGDDDHISIGDLVSEVGYTKDY